jgi:hypothetical protein
MTLKACRGCAAKWHNELVASFYNLCRSLKEQEKKDGIAVGISGTDGLNSMAIKRMPGCATPCAAFV